MAVRERPHVVWTSVVALAVACLGGLAWWLWSRPAGGAAPGQETGAEADGTPGGLTEAERELMARESLEAERAAQAGRISEAIERGDYEGAEQLLNAAESRLGWSEELGDLTARLDLRVAAFRGELRSLEFRVESFEKDESVKAVFARFSIGGTQVFATPKLAPSFALALDDQHVNLATLRTSLQMGASIELLEPGGFFGSAETVLGPLELSPLRNRAGGRLEFQDPDALVKRLTVSYRLSPYQPGLHPDEAAAHVPADATAAKLLDAFSIALNADQVDAAGALLQRMKDEHPGHPDAAFMAKRLGRRRSSLLRNETVARFVVIEASCDPRTNGKLWANGGEEPAFRASIALGASGRSYGAEGTLVPYIVPGRTLDPPAGNVIAVKDRGDLDLIFRLEDTSPTFGSSDVGELELGIQLSDLPRGSGTLVLERDPTVLVLPETDENRLRRLVLRWTVDR